MGRKRRRTSKRNPFAGRGWGENVEWMQEARRTPPIRVSPERAREIIAEAKAKAQYGPWSDQIDRVTKKGEHRYLYDLWNTLPGHYSFAGVLMDLAHGHLTDPATRNPKRRKSKPAARSSAYSEESPWRQGIQRTILKRMAKIESMGGNVAPYSDLMREPWRRSDADLTSMHDALGAEHSRLRRTRTKRNPRRNPDYGPVVYPNVAVYFYDGGHYFSLRGPLYRSKAVKRRGGAGAGYVIPDPQGGDRVFPLAGRDVEVYELDADSLPLSEDPVIQYAGMVERRPGSLNPNPRRRRA